MISKRIRRIASLIPDNVSVCDVGCDHGYLAVCLRFRGHKGHIVCADKRVGPLENCLRNVLAFSLQDVDVVLSDGVRSVETQCDYVVIAGMGYHNVVSIMSESPEYFKKTTTILQINKDTPMLRKWLTENGYKIVGETMIKDYHFYEILTVRRGRQKLREKEIKYGRYLLRENSETFRQCWQIKLEKLQKIKDGLTASHPDIDKIDEEIKEIKAVLKAR